MGMFCVIDTPDYFSQLLATVIAFYIIVSICFSLTFSGTQALAFPSLNNSNIVSTSFVLFVLLTSICFSFNVSHSFLLGSFVFDLYTCFFQVVLLFSVLSFLIVSKEFTRQK